MPSELHQMSSSFYPSKKLNNYWWIYLGLQSLAPTTFSMLDSVIVGMWMNLCAFNYFILPHCFYYHLHFILCLAKPITPLCWYLVVLGYLFVLHPISIVMYIAFMYIWMNGISHLFPENFDPPDPWNIKSIWFPAENSVTENLSYLLAFGCCHVHHVIID